MKKFFAALISCLMVCFVLPAIPAAAISYPIPSTGNIDDLIIKGNGDLYLGLEQLENPVQIGSGTMSLNAGVLTLENVHFSTGGRIALDIQYQSDLTINLIGTNSITSTFAEASSYGICFDYGLNFTGTGSLTVTGGDADNSYGLACEYNYPVTVSGCTVTVIGGDAMASSTGLLIDGGDITVRDGGRLIVSSGTGYSSCACRLYSGSITVDNGYFSAAAGNGSASSYGISDADVTVRNGGSVNISGDTAAGYNSTLTDGDGNVTDLDDILSINVITDPEEEPDDPEPEDITDTSIPPHLISSNIPYGYQPVFPVVTPIVIETENFDVTAILNKSGSVDSAKTRIEIIKAARTKGVTQITLILPENCKGISTAAIQKLVKAAGDKKLFLTYGDVTIELKADTKQILTGV